MQLSKEYIAGFIDGEGYLGIIKKSTNRTSRGYYYCPVIKIAQVTKNDLVLKNIKEFIGYGNFSFDKKNVTSSNSAQKSALEFRGMKRVFPIVEKLYPYLIVKQKQAGILLEFQKLENPMKYGKTDLGKNERDRIDKQRESLYNQIRSLNARGLVETKRRNPKGMQ